MLNYCSDIKPALQLVLKDVLATDRKCSTAWIRMKYVFTMSRHCVGYGNRAFSIVLSAELERTYIPYLNKEHSTTTSVNLR